MAERTLSISSGGKTFSFTGWKVGWVTGPAPLVAAVRAAKQFLTYTSGAPFQLAIARGLSGTKDALNQLGSELKGKRDLWCDGLATLGFTVYRPAATYFATTDIGAVAPGMPAYEFCRTLRSAAGSWPYRVRCSTAPTNATAGQTLVRWAFCKQVALLEEALGRLAAWSL